MAKQPSNRNNKNAKFRPSNQSNNQKRNKNNKNIQARKGGVKKRPLKASPNKVQDARQKILQKKRKTVTDAREVLAHMAKTQDARNKINKIRQSRTGAVPTANGNIRPIGTSILQKTDRNGKISLVTSKSKAAVDMNIAIQKQLGLITSPRSPTKKVLPKRVAQRKEPFAIKAVMDEYDYHPSPLHTPARGYNSSLYKWMKPNLRNTAASQMIGSLDARRQMLDDRLLYGDRLQQQFTITRPREYINLVDVEDEEMPQVPLRQTISLQGSTRVTNVHSRLDTVPVQPESHGILSQPKTKVVVPAGHRIVVSNLQPTVSQDDIKELFEDIGQLLAARLVRPGVAEVIYKNLKDAQKAVDTYHNRQLDGQPMKCLLVNKRPLNNPTAPPLTKLESQGYSLTVTRYS